MTRVIGPPKSRRRHWLFLLSTLVTAGFCVLYVSGALATGTQAEGVYQLDGNALSVLGSTPTMPPATEDADYICKGQRTAAGGGGTNDGSNAAGQVCNIPASYPSPLFPSGYALPGGTSSTRFAFVTDGSGNFPSGASEDIYTGGSKDGSDVSTWVYKTAASSNDKSDIENAFAAFYTASTTGDKVVYFGGDRTSNSGDENTAFWFLQSPAMESPCSNITGSGCPFTTDGLALASDGSNAAHHVAANPGSDNCLVPQGQSGVANAGISFTTGLACTGSAVGDSYGDILVVSAFTGGGTQPNITAYEWIGNGFAKGASSQFCGTSSCTTIQILQSTPGCTAAEDTAACAITDQGVTNPPGTTPGNTMPTPSPWVYTEKSSDSCTSNSCGASKCTVTANAMCPGIFFEAGLNLTKLGLQSECTSTMVMDTRSSQSVDASLQDLAIGQVGSCQTTISTTPKNGVGDTTAPDDPTSNTALSIGTGTVKATDLADLTVTNAASWTGTLKFFLCGPILPANTSQTCDGTTNVGLQIGTTQTVTQASGTSDGSGGRLILSSQALLTSAANKSTGAPGHYCWRSEFHSNTSGVPDKSDSSSTECFVVNPVTVTPTTSATCKDSTGTVASPCILGDTLSDTATLSGTATEPGTNSASTQFPTIFQGSATPTLSKAGGTITWTLYPPNSSGNTQCATTATLTTSTAAVNNGDDTYPRTGATPPQTAITYTTGTSDPIGTWTFSASYNGDNPNTVGGSDSCSTTSPDTAEQVSVTATSGITTAQSWLPQDTATITATGGTPAGSVEFKLYETANCTGAVVQDFTNRPVALNSGDSKYEASTNNTTYYTTTKTISWRAIFTSSNSIPGSTSHCETMSVSTLNNDIGS